jgi:basic amino acid/polyamine antiporter, APA family
MRGAAAAESSSALPRQLGLWSAVAVLIGTTIGSGIFRSPASIADRLPGPLPMLSLWVFGGVYALCGALTLAEISGAYPHTGGLYVFLREGWGRLWAFLFGWAELAIIRAAALGAISTTFAEYLVRVTGNDPRVAPYDDYVHYIAAIAIALVASLNIVGLRWSSILQNTTTIAKFGGLLFIIILAFALGLPKTGGYYTPAAPPGSFAFGAFGLALVSVMWAYDGWADLSFISGEVKDPRRNLPRAIIIGTLAVIVIYMLANLAYLAILPVDQIRTSRLVAADVAEKVMGSVGVVFVAVTVMLSTFGTLNGSILTQPRIFFAMAQDGLFFKTFGQPHPKFRTPHKAIIMTALLGIAFVMLRTFEQLADAFVTAIVPFYALGVAAVFTLRKRADYDPPMRTPLFPIPPIVFVLGTAYLLLNAIIDESSRWATLGTLGLIALGIPVYYLTVGRGPGVPEIARETR